MISSALAPPAAPRRILLLTLAGLLVTMPASALEQAVVDAVRPHQPRVVGKDSA